MWTFESLERARRAGVFVPYSPQSPGSNVFHNNTYNGILESLVIPDYLSSPSQETIEMLDWPLATIRRYEELCEGGKRDLIKMLKNQQGKIFLVSLFQNEIVQHWN